MEAEKDMYGHYIYYDRTMWTQEEIDTWDDPEPETAKPKLELVVNNGRNNF